MAATPPHDAQAESSAMATAFSNSLQTELVAVNSLQTELVAALAVYRDSISLMKPTRDEYDSLFFRHKKIQARYDKAIEKISSRQATYEHHKRYFGLLSNALRASNAALDSTTVPVSDLQSLTHVTLMNDFRHASHTLTTMIFQIKRLEQERDKFYNIDQKVCQRCHGLYLAVDKDCRKLDILHAQVRNVERMLGKKPGCKVDEGKCLSCARMQAVAAKVRKANEGGNQTVEKRRKFVGSLADIIEEEEDLMVDRSST